LSTSIIQSEGIHNGVIVNLSKASNTIRSCISTAEKKAKILIKKVNVVIEQPEFLCTKLSKHKKINGSKIHKDDIEFLLKEAKKQVILNDDKQSIIHIFNHNYIVDGKTFMEEPIDVYANSLSHEMTFITTPKNNLKNIKQAFIECDIEVERFISCIFALAVKLLKNNELQFGSILIDIGFEKTSLGIFKNLALVHSITLSVGINHIIKDISKICSLNPEESEIISNKIDFSFQNNKELFDGNGYLRNIYFNNSSYRKISQSLILDIAKARLDEIFEMIQKQIIVTGMNPTRGTNLFIVGGGSHLSNLEKYCSNFFKSNVKKLGKNNKKEGERESKGNLVSCLGALKIIKHGWETEAIPELVNKNSQKLRYFAKFFGNKL
jgi:cell division protein FtsA